MLILLHPYKLECVTTQIVSLIYEKGFILIGFYFYTTL